MLKQLGWVIICSTFLTACTGLSYDGDRSARCKVIKQRMLFNGAASNQLLEAQQNAEMGGLERDFHNLDCN